MARWYIVNLEDGVTTKTEDAMVANYYVNNDEYVVIDTVKSTADYYGEATPIGDDSYDPDEPGEPDVGDEDE